jgi:hypothetical protein
MIYKGVVTLVGASGSVTLGLSGEVFGPLRLGGKIDLTYTITGGTGAFQGATGSGKADLTLELPPSSGPSASPPGLTFVLTFGGVA